MSDHPTPKAVLDYWIGAARHDALAADVKHKLWFRKSAQTDNDIRRRFLPTLEALSSGLSEDWGRQGAQARLAAIIVLDQFSRNLFRDDPRAFAQDPLARKLSQEGIARNEDKTLTEVERIFFYLPFEHSEEIADQDRSVALFSKLLEDARPAYKDMCKTALDFAKKHRDVVVKYGRFPHRNAVLGRANTVEERDYLAQPGAGF